MKKLALVVGGIVGFVVMADSASAGISVQVNLGGGHCHPRPVYCAPAPVYCPPPVVVYRPAPVYYYERPAVVIYDNGGYGGYSCEQPVRYYQPRQVYSYHSYSGGGCDNYYSRRDGYRTSVRYSSR
jgi:hypothetical protein